MNNDLRPGIPGRFAGARAFVRVPRAPSILMRCLALLLGGCPLLGVTAAAADNGDEFQINVRSSVERAYTTFSKEPYHEHGKSYAIIGFDQVKNDAPLAKPVNRLQLYNELQKILSAYGFHEPAAGINPEIVLTVLYGRSWMRNPYLDGVVESPPGDFGGVPTYTASVDQMIREKTTPGYADKVISANAEKLFIAVTAWQFPKTAKEKPRQLWRTVMLTDDPDRDLNLAAEKLLAAGAAYFDHPIEKEEISISSTVAQGHVEVGTPTVVEPGKPGK
jgi:hypothetical protein